MIIDGATVTLNGAAFRIQSQVANGIATLSVTNGGSLTIAGTGGQDLQIGTPDAHPSSTNIADIQGTVNVTNNVRMGASGLLAVLNLGSGGVLVANAIVSEATNNVTEVNLDGGTLQANDAAADFMEGLTNAFIRSGGVTIDTAYNITIRQDLLDGGGGGGLTKTRHRHAAARRHQHLHRHHHGQRRRVWRRWHARRTGGHQQRGHAAARRRGHRHVDRQQHPDAECRRRCGVWAKHRKRPHDQRRGGRFRHVEHHGQLTHGE